MSHATVAAATLEQVRWHLTCNAHDESPRRRRRPSHSAARRQEGERGSTEMVGIEPKSPQELSRLSEVRSNIRTTTPLTDFTTLNNPHGALTLSFFFFVQSCRAIHLRIHMDHSSLARCPRASSLPMDMSDSSARRHLIPTNPPLFPETVPLSQ